MKLREVVVVSVLLVGGCKKKQSETHAAGSAVSSGSAVMPADAADGTNATPDSSAGNAGSASGSGSATTGDLIPADATVVPERDSKKADASALGDVSLRLVNKPDPGDQQLFDQVLVLRGKASMVVGIARVQTSDPPAGNGPVAVAPLDPPRPFAAKDAVKKLPFKGPLLYFGHWRAAELGEDVAVAHDGDAIVVWRSEWLNAEGEDETNDWYEEARIKLAPGAKVTAQ